MTRDEITKMARDCGWAKVGREMEYPVLTARLERFAALVATAEREECALIAEAYEPRCDTCPSGVANAIRARGA